MNQKYLTLVLLLAILFVTNSLGAINLQNKDKTSLLRLDKDLYSILKSPDTKKEEVLVNKYPTLLPAFTQTITNTSSQDNAFENLREYFSHPALLNVYSDAIKQFDDMSQYETELEVLSNIAKSELNVQKLPTFSVHVSGFKENTIYVNNIISLSIDKYMGKDYPIYKQFFDAHQLEQMQPKMMSRDFAKAWLMADFIKTESTSGDLLSEMIEQGKLLYALSILIPTYTERELIGYTTSEYDWALANTKSVWDYILKRNQLYTLDHHIISSYFDENQSAKSDMRGVPPQIGAWIGFQIVKHYANKHSNESLSTIISKDAKTILKGSKYAP